MIPSPLSYSPVELLVRLLSSTIIVMTDDISAFLVLSCLISTIHFGGQMRRSSTGIVVI